MASYTDTTYPATDAETPLDENAYVPTGTGADDEHVTAEVTAPEPTLDTPPQQAPPPQTTPEQPPPQTTSSDDDMKMMLSMFKQMQQSMAASDERNKRQIELHKAEMIQMKSEVLAQVTQAKQTAVPESIGSHSTLQVPPHLQAEQVQAAPQHFQLFEQSPPQTTTMTGTRLEQLIMRKTELRAQVLTRADVDKTKVEEIIKDIDHEVQIRQLGWTEAEINKFIINKADPLTLTPITSKFDPKAPIFDPKQSVSLLAQGSKQSTWQPTLGQSIQTQPFEGQQQGQPTTHETTQSTPPAPTGFMRTIDGNFLPVYDQSTSGPHHGSSYQPRDLHSNIPGQNMSYVKVPTWDGQSSTLKQYKLDVALLENSIAPHNRPMISSRLLGELTGAAAKYLHIEPELIGDATYKVEGGCWKLIDYLADKLGVTSRDEQHKAFQKFFLAIRRTPGETFQSYEHREELAYREMQKALRKVHTGDTGTIDLESTKTFELPDSLRGWFYLERSGLKQADKTSLILQCGGETKLSKLKPLIQATYPSQVMAKYESTKATGHYLDQDYPTDETAEGDLALDLDTYYCKSADGYGYYYGDESFEFDD